MHMNDIDRLYAEIEALKARIVVLENNITHTPPKFIYPNITCTSNVPSFRPLKMEDIPDRPPKKEEAPPAKSEVDGYWECPSLPLEESRPSKESGPWESPLVVYSSATVAYPLVAPCTSYIL